MAFLPGTGVVSNIWALRPAVKCEIVIRKWEVGSGKEVGSRKLVNPDGECRAKQ